MADGNERQSRGRGLNLVLLLMYLFILSNIVSVNTLDSTLDIIREEGVEKSDISIFVEKRVEFIHSRIVLKPLITSLEHGFKLSNEFSIRANSSLGKILSSKLRSMITKTSLKLENMVNVSGKRSTRSTETTQNRSKRAIEFVGNLISKLFGNPGPDEWKQNTRNMLAMKAAI